MIDRRAQSSKNNHGKRVYSELEAHSCSIFLFSLAFPLVCKIHEKLVTLCTLILFWIENNKFDK